eukprot:jgi/Bigna1/78504/fgenesh1_pg.55_\
MSMQRLQKGGSSLLRAVIIKNSENVDSYKEWLSPYATCIEKYPEDIESVKKLSPRPDFILLTGGNGERKLTKGGEIFIRETEIPILGICYGLQQVAKAYDEGERGARVFSYPLKDPRLNMVEEFVLEKKGGRTPLMLAYNHAWGIDASQLLKLSIGFQIDQEHIKPNTRVRLSGEREKNIDLVLKAELRHGDKYFVGFQGHPEKDATSYGLRKSVLREFLATTRKISSRSNGNSIPVFSYGSNSVSQLVGRLNITDPLSLNVRGAKLRDFIRTFAGNSRGWNGSVANITPVVDKVVYGIVVDVTPAQLELLDRFEGVPNVYERKSVRVDVNTDAKLECQVYIRRSSRCESPPSKQYLCAIGEMLMDRRKALGHSQTTEMKIHALDSNERKLRDPYVHSRRPGSLEELVILTNTRKGLKWELPTFLHSIIHKFNVVGVNDICSMQKFLGQGLRTVNEQFRSEGCSAITTDTFNAMKNVLGLA